MPLKIIRLKRSPNLYLRGTVRGVPVFETTGTPDEDAAEQIRIRRESELLKESIHGPSVSRRFAEAALAHMERAGASERERRFIFPLIDEWGGLLCADIGQEHIDRYIRHRYSTAKPSTIVRQVVTPATAVLTTAANRKWCQTPHFERPKVRRAPHVAMTHEQFANLHAGAADHLQPLLLFLAYTGARLAEALELTWDRVSLQDRWAWFDRTKRDEEPRGVPLHHAVVVALVNIEHRKGAVFRTDRGQPYEDKGREEGGQIKTAWCGACRAAGLATKGRTYLTRGGRKRTVWKPAFTPHKLRHAFSTWAIMAGMHPYDKDQIMGHASTDMSRHYTHLPQPHLLAAIDLLPAFAGAPSGEKSVKRKMRKAKKLAVANG